MTLSLFLFGFACFMLGFGAYRLALWFTGQGAGVAVTVYRCELCKESFWNNDSPYLFCDTCGNDRQFDVLSVIITADDLERLKLVGKLNVSGRVPVDHKPGENGAITIGGGP